MPNNFPETTWVPPQIIKKVSSQQAQRGTGGTRRVPPIYKLYWETDHNMSTKVKITELICMFHPQVAPDKYRPSQLARYPRKRLSENPPPLGGGRGRVLKTAFGEAEYLFKGAWRLFRAGTYSLPPYSVRDKISFAQRIPLQGAAGDLSPAFTLFVCIIIHHRAHFGEPHERGFCPRRRACEAASTERVRGNPARVSPLITKKVAPFCFSH